MANKEPPRIPRGPRPDPQSRAWRAQAADLALGYCPAIYPCADCGRPVISGYCCTTCGSEDPGRVARKEGARVL